MIVINNIDDKKFSFNGVNYYKNFTPKVVGNKIEILNTYDSDIRLTDYPTLFSEFEVNGNTYASVSSLQDALLPTVFTRDGLGGGGANILNDLADVNTVDLEDGDALTWDADSNNWINKHNVIQIDRYENIPLKEGVYSIYIYNEGGSVVFPSEYSLELPTNVFRYSDNTTILSPNFMQYSDDQTIVKREFRINDNGYVLTDTFYDINGVEIGTVLPQETTPTLNVSYSFYSSVKYVSDLYDNSYIRLNKPFGVESLKPIFGNINIKLNELNYENGLLSFDFDFPEYIKIEEASLIYGNFSTQNFKIGLIESDTENKLGILDYSGILENDLNKNEVVLNVVYTETISSLASKRIKPFNNNNTLVNVVNLEQEVSHSNAMTLTFEEVYGVFNGVVYNASSPNIEDLFNVKIIETERQSVNADIYFSAGSGMGFLKTFELEDSYGIVPLGSNDLIRQDLTDAIDKFPTNYIAVTSRSETDNDGTDPLGTSYGFGVEFNEPTLSADLTGQGLTDWGGSSEHQQSPATAIVSGKLKYIKDQTGAPWDIIREACRQTASNANSYNIYRGFGKIDTASAIALIPTLLNTRSQELAEYYEATTVMPLELKYEDKSLNTLVNKRDLENNAQASLVGYRETGTPEDEDLLVEIGDFDNAGSGFRVEVDAENAWLNVRSESTKSSRLDIDSLNFIDGVNESKLLKPSKTGSYTENIATEQYVDYNLKIYYSHEETNRWNLKTSKTIVKPDPILGYKTPILSTDSGLTNPLTGTGILNNGNITGSFCALPYSNLKLKRILLNSRNTDQLTGFRIIVVSGTRVNNAPFSSQFSTTNVLYDNIFTGLNPSSAVSLEIDVDSAVITDKEVFVFYAYESGATAVLYAWQTVLIFES